MHMNAPEGCQNNSPREAQGAQATGDGARCVRERPTWDDRFSQYGIKVSFWGSGTLKIVIYVEN